MTKTGWFVAVIIVIIAAVALLWWNSASAPAVDEGAATTVPTDLTGSPQTDTSETNTLLPGGAPMSATVSYDGSAFSPDTVTIAKGGTVTFTDTAGATMWVASGMHPVHSGYDSTTLSAHCAAGYAGAAPFDQCKAGASYSFTFDKVGSWGFHDHKNSSAFGKIIVQ